MRLTHVTIEKFRCFDEPLTVELDALAELDDLLAEFRRGEGFREQRRTLAQTS